MLSFSSYLGRRVSRTRLVLLALPGFVTLVFLTSLYHNREISAKRDQQPGSTAVSIDRSAISDSQWDAQALRRSVCWTEWFSTGIICERPPQQWSRQGKIDLVWTWSNATFDVSSSAMPTESTSTASKDSQAIAHAASTDLLRYSIRSAQSYMHDGFGSVSLLTPEHPKHADKMFQANERCKHTYQDDRHTSHTGQRPCWLATMDPVFEPPALLHHRQIACATHADRTKDACSEARLAESEPFTAKLLATQAPVLSDVRLLLESHHIFMDHVSSSDFWSPLYGAAFRVNAIAHGPGDVLSSQDPTLGDAPLIRANGLLDRRFGTRSRRKLLDLPQPLSSSMLQELQLVWPKELDRDSSASSSNQVDLSFLMAHFTFEKFREALLWAFVVAKHDRDGDGLFSSKEARALLRDLDAVLTPTGYEFKPVRFPKRATTSHVSVAKSLQSVGLPLRLGREVMQTSMDGNAILTLPSFMDQASSESINQEESDGITLPRAGNTTDMPGAHFCTLERECLAPLIDLITNSNPRFKPSTSEVFSRFAFLNAPCGDCMVMHLVGKSGHQGLSAFLPSPDLVMAPMDSLPLSSTHEDADFSLPTTSTSPRVKRLDVVSRLLSRYVHTVVLQEPYVTPQMSDRLQTQLALARLEYFNTSSLFSFKQHGRPEARSTVKAEDAWIWAKFVRGWLSIRYPFAMRFESNTNEL